VISHPIFFLFCFFVFVFACFVISAYVVLHYDKTIPEKQYMITNNRENLGKNHNTNTTIHLCNVDPHNHIPLLHLNSGCNCHGTNPNILTHNRHLSSYQNRHNYIHSLYRMDLPAIIRHSLCASGKREKRPSPIRCMFKTSFFCICNPRCSDRIRRDIRQNSRFRAAIPKPSISHCVIVNTISYDNRIQHSKQTEKRRVVNW
jgi:hypothetical protein